MARPESAVEGVAFILPISSCHISIRIDEAGPTAKLRAAYSAHDLRHCLCGAAREVYAVKTALTHLNATVTENYLRSPGPGTVAKTPSEMHAAAIVPTSPV